jgi:hypothetical protein
MIKALEDKRHCGFYRAQALFWHFKEHVGAQISFKEYIEIIKENQLSFAELAKY